MGMDVDNFGSSNVNNYNETRDHTITSNKTSSRSVSMSLSSDASVNYTTRIEQLNDVPDNEETREPIDSLQLSYTELKKIQVSGATNYDNRMRI